jgi:DNA-binding MarR family transcriptional regulator
MYITRSQWWVLSGVSRHFHEGITQTELAQVLDLGKMALGNLVDRLEESGFVERRANPNDRRVHMIHLTRKGETILKKMERVSIEMNAKIMRGISSPERHRLAKVLAKIKGNLVAMDTVPGAKRRAKTLSR